MPSSVFARCEIKPGPQLRPYSGLVDMVLATLDARDMMARTVISSFHLEILRDVAQAGWLGCAGPG